MPPCQSSITAAPFAIARFGTTRPAASSAPEPLGEQALGLLPPQVGADLPLYSELLEALRVTLPADEVGRIEPLRDLDARLAEYQASVDATLDSTTAEFIRRLATDPAASLDFLGNNR